MTVDHLNAAASAYLAARNEEDATKRALDDAKVARTVAAAKVAKAREPLVDEIVKAARLGVRQRDILARIGGAYTRERVRQICRAAGVEPAE